MKKPSKTRLFALLFIYKMVLATDIKRPLKNPKINPKKALFYLFFTPTPFTIL